MSPSAQLLSTSPGEASTSSRLRSAFRCSSRIPAAIVARQLDQIEGIEKRTVISLAPSKKIE
jgi:hypothetical protein